MILMLLIAAMTTAMLIATAIGIHNETLKASKVRPPLF
jgi:hypothetical protein